MVRFKVVLEYDGGGFVGWQRQASGLSVQEVLETALAGLCSEVITVHGAGRTDAGVHALGQVAHFDIEKSLSLREVRDGLNFYLRPAPVVVLSAAAVGDDFHARFSATARHYRYRIVNRRAPLALEKGRATHIIAPLDHEAMDAAGQCLVGRHDFTSFRATACQAKDPVKTLDRLAVRRAGEEVTIDVSARSFLHHQVRNIAGTLLLVGEGKWGMGDVAHALAARDRAVAGPTAPPEGLYLLSVDYGAGSEGEK